MAQTIYSLNDFGYPSNMLQTAEQTIVTNEENLTDVQTAEDSKGMKVVTNHTQIFGGILGLILIMFLIGIIE